MMMMMMMTTVISSEIFSESVGVRAAETAPNDAVRIEVLGSRSHGSSGTDGGMGHRQEAREDASRYRQVDEPSAAKTAAAGSSAEQHADDTRKSIRGAKVCMF